MQKYKYIFVEKLGGENIYVFTYIYTSYFCKYTQELITLILPGRGSE